MLLPVFDPVYLLFMIPPLLLGLIATILLNTWTKAYLKVNNSNGLTGLEVAEKISRGLHMNFKVNIIPQVLGESWDPTSATLNISQEIAYGHSLAGAGIVAHEMGHMEQQKVGSSLFKIRSRIVPVVNIGSNLGYLLIVIGLLIQFTGLCWLGIILFSLTTVFALITLPIEFDASNRALKLLTSNGIVYNKELGGIKKVLSAAALTYVAALFQSLGQLFYFIFRVQGYNRRSS